MIVLASRLRRRERHATLTHEAVHVERGITTSDMPAALVVKEERAVDAIATARLVPVDELARFIARKASIDEGVHAHEVADEFDVPEYVAVRACRMLTQSAVSRHPSAGR